MAFRSEVDNIVEVVFLKQRSHQLLIADVTLHKHMARVALHALEVFQISRIGQLVEIDEQNVVIFLQHVVNKVGADKAGATSNQIFFHVLSSPIPYINVFNCRHRVINAAHRGTCRPKRPSDTDRTGSS